MPSSDKSQSVTAVNPTEYPVEPVFRHRWSPYRFEPREVEEAKLLRCLEAARWAASSFNEQPWSWIVAFRQDTAAFEEMLGCLIEANQVWAKHSGVLMITAIRTSFAANGQPNRVALHDLGLAAGQLTLQATAEGMQVHQMAGVNLSRARATYEIPEGFEPQTAIAIGYPATEPAESEAARELERRDDRPRKRKALSEQVFAGKFGRVAEIARARG